VRTGRLRVLTPTTCASGFHIAFSQKGGLLAAGSFCGREVFVWNLATGRRIVVPPIDGQISAVAFSPDAKRLTSEPHTAELWVRAGVPGSV
jgi:WD40 repeat protein